MCLLTIVFICIIIIPNAIKKGIIMKKVKIKFILCMLLSLIIGYYANIYLLNKSEVKIENTIIIKNIEQKTLDEMAISGKLSYDTLYFSKSLNELRFFDTDGNEYKIDSASNRISKDNFNDNYLKQFWISNTEDIRILNGKNNKTSSVGFIAITIIAFFYVIRFFKNKKIPTQIETERNSKKDNVKGTFEIESSKITLDTIRGHKEVKKDIYRLIDIIKRPEIYLEMGAKIPKGIILYGPPGTGKTSLARAIAGEAGVNFISVSGGEFIEKYVGVGAKRIRELFVSAKKQSPCIIFIDEFDAIARRRAEDSNGEYLQTVNQLLTELDGFNKAKETVFVMVSTNRLDMLDEAIIRPGRFDKHVAIGLPDYEDRLEIIDLYISDKTLHSEVDVTSLAQKTVGFSGAMIEVMLNEAAILAVSRDKKFITLQEIDDAYLKVITHGDKKVNGHVNFKTQKIVAYHEAGHAIIHKLINKARVPKVSIIPTTTGAGGWTIALPDENIIPSRKELKGKIMGLYGGRAAEYLLLGNEEEITSGASNDIEKATELLVQMIGVYGMSDEVGLVSLNKIPNFDMTNILEIVKQKSKEYYKETIDTLKKHEHLLHVVANTLIKKETLEEKELDEIIEKNENPASKENKKGDKIIA